MKKQDENLDKDVDRVANEPTRPVRLRGSKRPSVAGRRNVCRKKGKENGGIQERCNKRMNW